MAKPFSELRDKMPKESQERAAAKAAELVARNDLMRVTVQIGARRFDEDLAAQAFIAPNVEALNDAMATNPGRYAEWAMLEAMARSEVEGIKGQVAKLDSDIKEREAQAYLDIIGDAERAGVKPPTVDAIKATVVIDPRRIEMVRRRQALEDAQLAAEANLGKLTVGKRTIEEKKDSLLELARNWRQEMQGKLQVSMGDMSKYKPGGR